MAASRAPAEKRADTLEGQLARSGWPATLASVHTISALADRYRASIERELADQTYLDPTPARSRSPRLGRDLAASARTPQAHDACSVRGRAVQARAAPLGRLSRSPGSAMPSSPHGSRGCPPTVSGPSTVAYAYRVLSLMLDLALRDGRIARNPAVGVKLPRKAAADKRYLTHRQVTALAEAAGRKATSSSFLPTAGCAGASSPRFASRGSTLRDADSTSSSP